MDVRTWPLLFLLLIGLVASVVGYVGCFSVVQNSRTTIGPVSWLCLDVQVRVTHSLGLSVMCLGLESEIYLLANTTSRILLCECTYVASYASGYLSTSLKTLLFYIQLCLTRIRILSFASILLRVLTRSDSD